MTNLKTAMVALGFLALSTQAVMAENKKEESYNYKRGVELLLEDDDMDRGLQFLNKEIADHKDNGYAHLWISRVYHRQGKYGQALDAACKAIKYLGKDTEKLAFAYYHRANIYDMLDEEEKMLNDLTMANKFDPESRDAYKMRGDYYYNKEQYDLADADYQKMIEIQPGDLYGYMALGRNEMNRGHYEEAIEKFEYVMKLDPDYVYAYPFRAEAKMKQKKYSEAMDDVIYTFQKEIMDDKAGYVFAALCDSMPQLVNSKLKAQVKKEPNNAMWHGMLATSNQYNKQWKEAIKWYESALQLEHDLSIGKSIKDCYSSLGNMDKALEWTNWTIAQDSTDLTMLADRVMLEDELGLKDEAWRHVNELIEQFPDHYYGYYRRGWMKDKNHASQEEAIEDYTMAVSLYPQDCYSYMARGQVYMQQGKMGLAKADFERCMELDSLCFNTNSAMFAAYYLGDSCRALALKDSILDRDVADSYYDIACLYSLMDSTQQAMHYLRLNFEADKSNFFHARRDQDLERVRQLPEFEALLQEFEAKRESAWKAESDGAEYEEELIEIPFTREGGLCMVKCTINGLPLHFCFDTGASDVGLSSVEAAFMLKNGYLDKSDFYGKSYFSNANGDISEGTNIRLREINFGGLVLKDIKASVAKSQKAPLLLGQTVLQHLGKIEIDNERKVLKVTRTVKK